MFQKMINESLQTLLWEKVKEGAVKCMESDIRKKVQTVAADPSSLVKAKALGRPKGAKDKKARASRRRNSKTTIISNPPASLNGENNMEALVSLECPCPRKARKRSSYYLSSSEEDDEAYISTSRGEKIKPNESSSQSTVNRRSSSRRHLINS
jgi:hypothetical protein